MRRIASGSSRSPSAVDPVTSQKTTVTVLRTSRGAATGVSAAPQLPQNRNPSGLSWPQAGHAGTPRVSQLSRSCRHVFCAPPRAQTDRRRPTYALVRGSPVSAGGSRVRPKGESHMIGRRLGISLAVASFVLFAIGSYAVAGPRDSPGKVPDSKKFEARLNGFQETPSVSTTGFGNFEAELVEPTKLHFVFHYEGLEGGTSLFAHVHFGQRGVAGGVSFFLCGPASTNAPVTCPDVQGDCRGRHHAGQRDRAERPGHRAGVVRRDPARDAGRTQLREHPHDPLARRRDPRADQRQGSEGVRQVVDDPAWARRP